MNRIPHVRAYLGPEEGLRSDALAELRQVIASRSGMQPDEHRFYLPDDSIEDAMAILDNGSLFGDHRLVLVIGAEQIKKKADVQLVADYVSRASDGATLVLISTAPRLDTKLHKQLPGDSIKVFWELFENQKVGWVQGYFRKQGVSITPEALDLFLELVENNTQELRLEADKLTIYAKSRIAAGATDEIAEPPQPLEIGVEHVESFVFHSREENVFSLHKKIVDGDLDGGLAVLAKMVGSGEGNPSQLIGGLAFQTRRLIGLRTLIEEGLSLDEAFSRARIRGKRIQSDYRAALDRFSLKELGRQMHVLVESEAATREHGSAIHTLFLELLVYRLLFPGPLMFA